MGLIIFLIIFYNLIAKNNPKMHDKVKKRMPLLIFLFFMFEGLKFSGALLGSIFGEILALGIVASPFIVIGWLIKKIVNRGKRENSEEYKSVREEAREDINLTDSVPKRRKIVQKFSSDYSLNLTVEQIDNIVEASYTSYYWQREIFDMTKNYKFASQWYSGGSPWLRIYLYVFPVMDISSDFRRQDQIVEDTLCSIFKDIDPKSCYSVDDCIKKINDKYLTRFDEKSFMVAYRFLKSRKHNFKLPEIENNILKNESEIDDLTEKYKEFDYPETDYESDGMINASDSNVSRNKSPRTRASRNSNSKDIISDDATSDGIISNDIASDNTSDIASDNISDNASSDRFASNNRTSSDSINMSSINIEDIIKSGKLSDQEVLDLLKKVYGTDDNGSDSSDDSVAGN